MIQYEDMPRLMRIACLLWLRYTFKDSISQSTAQRWRGFWCCSSIDFWGVRVCACKGIRLGSHTTELQDFLWKAENLVTPSLIPRPSGKTSR